MTPRALEICELALQLDTSERSDLVARLIATLDRPEDEAAFRQTLFDRVEEIRSGAVETVPLEEALALIATPPHDSAR